MSAEETGAQRSARVQVFDACNKYLYEGRGIVGLMIAADDDVADTEHFRAAAVCLLDATMTAVYAVTEWDELRRPGPCEFSEYAGPRLNWAAGICSMMLAADLDAVDADHFKGGASRLQDLMHEIAAALSLFETGPSLAA